MNEPKPSAVSDSFSTSSHITITWKERFLRGRTILVIGILLFAGSLGGQLALEEKLSEQASDVAHELPKTDVPEREPGGSQHRHRLVILVSGWLLTFGKELGAVLVVSYLIRELIEESQQQVFQNTLSDKVRESLLPAIQQVEKLQEDLGITIRNEKIIKDAATRNLLTEKVLRPKLVRRNYRLTLTLEGEPSADRIRVTTESYYLVENLTTEAQEYSIVGWIDIIQDHWLSGAPPGTFTSLAYGPEHAEEQDGHRFVDLTYLSSKAKREKLNLELSYPITPDLPPRARYFTKMTSVQYMRRQEQFVWNMAYVTEGLEICVVLKGGLNWSNFEVNPRLMHHQEHFSHTPDMSPGNNQESRSWKLNSFLLPYQGVQIWWSSV